MTKRDNAYWLKRILAVRADLHADYLAGRILSVAEARRRAGLMSERTALHELKNAWRKASIAERRQFTSWALTGAAAPTPGAKWQVVDADRRLTPRAKKRIATIMGRRGLKMGDVMAELGFKRLNASLGNALKDTRVTASMVTPLEKWLDDNASV